MSFRLARALCLLPLVLAPACRRAHVHGAGCEAGLVPEAPPARAQQPVAEAPPKPAKAPKEPAGEALTAAEALATFDETWQRIHDTHFDPRFNGVDWQAARAELRPRAEAARTRAELRGVLDDLLGRLGQSHFGVIPSEALPEVGAGPADQSGGLGFDVRLREGRLLVTSLDPAGSAAAAGVKLGWSVLAIDAFDAGALLASMEAAAATLGPRKLAFNAWSVARGHVVGPTGTRATVRFQDGDGRSVELQLERKQRDVTVHEFGPNLPPFYLEFRAEERTRGAKRLGLIAFSNWFLPVMKPLDEAVERLRTCDGIVLDLRGNTGGAAAMTMGVAGHFFRESTRLGSMLTRDSTIHILAIPRLTNAAGQRVEPFAGPVAIVVDETTGSASEVLAGGMQSVGRARVFGEPSAGAVLPAVTTRLPNGDTLLHALGDFETARGTRLEGDGVLPDEPVPLTRAALLAGRDPALEAALDWLASAPR